MKNGFSLVELSIVLVIIGLLVGGILVGQSLIDSARINRFVSDIMQYEVMVEQFESKFRDLPGDNSLFPVAGRGTAVAGDGVISESDNTGYEATVSDSYDSEVGHFWQHLSQAGMTPQKYEVAAGPALADIVVGENAPEIYDDFPLIIFSVEPRSGVGFSFPAANFFGVAGAIAPVDAAAMDIKLDDGFAAKVASVSLAGPGLSLSGDQVVGINAGGNCQQTGSAPFGYDLSVTDDVCLVLIGFERKR